jgi:hypothetical protein
MDVVFTLLAERYERGSVLMTQLAILEMGKDFQRRDDDSGGDRSAGASLRDRRAEHTEPASRGGRSNNRQRGSDPGNGPW